MTEPLQPLNMDTVPLTIPPRRRLWFAVVTCGFVLAVSCFLLGVTEWILRSRHQRIQGSDVIEPGLLQHDDLLGWKLSPYAKISHQHQDFSVRYTINSRGFRGEEPKPKRDGCRLHLFVGDSFTFGLGVNDDETFVHHLNEHLGAKDYALNYAVPGYSTDQEVLLVERDLLKRQPDVVWLVVYLANDLLDNHLTVPFQFSLPKPRFQMVSKELVIENIPVPWVQTAATAGTFDLPTAVLGEDYVRNSWRLGWAQRSFLFRTINESWLSNPNLSDEFQAHLGPSVDLFAAILGRLQNDCAEKKVTLMMVLLPGRSFVDQPESISAQYQDYFRRKLVELDGRQGVRIIDLGPTLRKSSRRVRGGLFHPHEGHLTVLGHRVVAAELSERVSRSVRVE